MYFGTAVNFENNNNFQEYLLTVPTEKVYEGPRSLLRFGVEGLFDGAKQSVCIQSTKNMLPII